MGLIDCLRIEALQIGLGFRAVSRVDSFLLHGPFAQFSLALNPLPFSPLRAGLDETAVSSLVS